MSSPTAPSESGEYPKTERCAWCCEAPCICDMLDVIISDILKLEYPPPQRDEGHEEERGPYDFQ